MRRDTHTLAASGEHEFEAAPGLPESLPAGERLLWQGRPDTASLARHAFHLPWLVAYFALLLAWQFAEPTLADASWTATLRAALPLTVAGLAAIGLVGGLAVLSARSTVYTITDRRVVMRVGIVLTLTFNLPYTAVTAAGLRRLPRGCGDLPLTLESGTRIAILHLWPHARPWRLSHPQPMLRSVPDAERVATLLRDAWRARHPEQPAAAETVSAVPPGRTPVAARPATAGATAAALGS